MPGFKRTRLFGGALVCDIPEQFVDVRYVASHPVSLLLVMTAESIPRANHEPANKC